MMFRRSKKEFSRHLRKRRLQLSLSQADVSAKIGRSSNYMTVVERGDMTPSAEVLIKLARLFGENPHDYLSVRSKGGKKDQSNDIWKSLLSKEAGNNYFPGGQRIPVISQTRCGEWGGFGASDIPEKLIDEYEYGMTQDHKAFFLRADSDNMAPLIEPGDLVLVEPGTDVKSGNLVATQIDGGVVIKRLYITAENKILLLSENSKYPPITIKNKKKFQCFRVRRISRDV